MEANLTRGLTRSHCNFVKFQRVFSRAQSTVSKAKPVTAKVDPKAPMASLTWPDYLAIRHSKRKWQMVREKITRKGVTNSNLSGCYDPFRLDWFIWRSSLLRHPWCRPNETNHGIYTLYHSLRLCLHTCCLGYWPFFLLWYLHCGMCRYAPRLFSVWINILNAFGRRWSHHWSNNWNCVVATAISESPSPNWRKRSPIFSTYSEKPRRCQSSKSN